MLTLFTSLAAGAALVAAPIGPGRPLAPEELPREVYLDRTGFPELMIQSSLLGPLVGYAATRALFGEDDVRAASGFYLGLGGGVALPLLLLRRRPVTAARAAYYNLGERWGLASGLLVPRLLGAGTARASYAGVAGLVGIGLGAAVLSFPRLELTPGQVSALGSGHTFGLITSSLLLLLLDVVPASGAGFAGPALLVSNAGLVAAYLGRERFDVDRRRVIFTDLGGYLGLATGMGVGFVVTGGARFSGKTQVYAAAMLLGMVVGLGAGYGLSSGLDEHGAGIAEKELARLETPAPWILPAVGPTRPPAWGLSLLRGRF